MKQPDKYSLDYETFSPEDIKKVGAFKYASHPEAEILIAAISKNGETPLVWSVADPDLDALMLLQEAAESGCPIWAHNAQFEFAVSKYLWESTFGFPPPALEQWHCTAALCRLAAIPSSLADAGEFLGISLPKDKEGTRLIQRFCIPQKVTRKDPRPRIYYYDEPEDFQSFINYCVRDVVAEQQVHAGIKVIDQSSPGQRSYQADLRMNDRGIPVNRDALLKAEALVNEYAETLIPMFRGITSCPGETITMPVTSQRKAPKEVSLDEGFNPSQGEMMKAWLKERGFSGDDLQQETVERWLSEPLVNYLTPQAREALQTYSLIGSAAVKKIPAMLKMACDDGYVRGALMVYGAERTHRWTGKGIQPQNFARPTVGFTELAYHMICEGAKTPEIEGLFGNLYQVVASCIRHFIQPHEGMVLQADYSAIEARIAPWLCNEEKTLDMFRRNEPIYERMAAMIFGCKPDEVTKDERFIGKQSVLGCSYNMGRPKFRATCESYGFQPSEEMVESYKPRHKAFVAAAIQGVKNEVSSKFEKTGIPVPAKYFTEEFYQGKAMKDNGWTTLDPQTFEQWRHFTYDDLADRAVSTWRKNNPKIVSMWRELDTTAKKAIETPGELFTCGKLTLGVINLGSFPALCIKLPSGHYLVYPKPSVVKNETRGWGTQIKFWGVIPNSGGTWGWCFTYGGKLLENCTQGCAGDVMREGMMAAEGEGYLPFMLVHDELLAIQQEGQTHERLCELLCTMPAWADGLPLAAEGSTIPFYKK